MEVSQFPFHSQSLNTFGWLLHIKTKEVKTSKVTKATAEEVLYEEHPKVDYCCFDRKSSAAAGFSLSAKHMTTNEKSLF